MTYTKVNIHLTEAQIKRFKQAVENETPIGFTKYFSGPVKVPVLITPGQQRAISNKQPIKFSKKQVVEMKKDGGFLGAIANVFAKLLPAIKGVAKVAGPALATGALTGAASYGANRLLRETERKKGKGLHLKPYKSKGNGLHLKPYSGGNITIELTPCEVNSMLEPKEGGFLPILASLAAGLLPTLLGSGLSSSEIDAAKKIITKVGKQEDQKKAQEKLNQLTEKYGRGLLGKLFKLPGDKIPVLGDIPILNMLF